MLGAPPMALLGIPATPLSLVLLVLSFLLLLLGAEIFTNGVEWLGHRLGVSESATGSILAAVGTALPETMIPVIAITRAQLGSGSQAAADEVGVGAILGAPFMLATIAMFLIGVSVLYFRHRRAFGPEFHFNAVSTRRDLGFFLVGYTLAFAAALVERDIIAVAIGIVLVILYLVYVVRSLQSGELVGDDDLDDLYLGQVVSNGLGPFSPVSDGSTDFAENPSRLMTILQTLLALGIIIAGAHLFVEEVSYLSSNVLNIPGAVVALLLAPLATELPEKFNSVLWIARDKDTLAIGNITGAMAFQGTLPVTLGILFTSWDLSLTWGTTGFLNGISAVLAIVSGIILYARARSIQEGNMSPYPFLLGGIFYLVFLGLVVYHVVVLDLRVAAGH